MRHQAIVIVALSWLLLAPSGPGTAHAQRLDWKLEDFKPLTELPWDEEMKTPMEQVIFAIYHEPEYTVRRCLLDEYLRTLPDAELGKALDLCLQFEGTQSPDDLVEYFLGMWAKREPIACWERVKNLLKVVGIEHGWLGYDSWKDGRITVQNWEAIKASRFWLGPRALSGFAAVVEKSSLPRAERTKLLREFADAWITAFGEMPSPERSPDAPGSPSVPLAYMFSGSPMSRRAYIGGNSCISEIAARRYIKAFPAEAPEVMQQLSSEKSSETDPNKPASPNGPSRAVYEVWADADLAGMVRWADKLTVEKAEDSRRRYRDLDHVYIPKGLLMGRVDEKKRQQWMDQARKEGALYELMERWAQHDPKAALDAAVKLREAEILEQVLKKAAYGPQGGQPWNTSHPGMGVVRDYDFSGLPQEFYRQVFEESGVAIMEQWGDLDVGEAARFGLDFLLKSDYVPRENLTKLFSGDDEFASDADMIDRTFCALRVWAVTKPDEMKAWIGTLKEDDLRTALIWLLENPWGTGPEE